IPLLDEPGGLGDTIAVPLSWVGSAGLRLRVLADERSMEAFQDVQMVYATPPSESDEPGPAPRIEEGERAELFDEGFCMRLYLADEGGRFEGEDGTAYGVTPCRGRQAMGQSDALLFGERFFGSALYHPNASAAPGDEEVVRATLSDGRGGVVHGSFNIKWE
ncbi:MAG: hypothetical protein D6722_14305, partial [Bacteroidetes bacterium]